MDDLVAHFSGFSPPSEVNMTFKAPSDASLNPRVNTDEDEQDHDYIHHFSSESPAQQNAQPTRTQRRNLLNDLTTITQEDLGPSISNLKGGTTPEQSHYNGGGSSFEHCLEGEQRTSQNHYEELEFQQEDPNLGAYKGKVLEEAESLQSAMCAKDDDATRGTVPSTATASTATDRAYKPLNLDQVVQRWRQQSEEQDTIIKVHYTELS